MIEGNAASRSVEKFFESRMIGAGGAATRREGAGR